MNTRRRALQWPNPILLADLPTGDERAVPHPLLGSVPGVASPLPLSKTPVRQARAAPLRGVDTHAMLHTPKKQPETTSP